MVDSNWTKEWLINNGEKLKRVYSYAVVNKLDIKSKEDVLKILHAIDPKNANQEQAEKYSGQREQQENV